MPINQFKALIDICHLHGIAVIVDVVYNHAGVGIKGQDESIWFFDRSGNASDDNDSLYFTNQDHTGPVFAFWKEEVRQFLIDNAMFFAASTTSTAFATTRSPSSSRRTRWTAGRSART